MKRMDLTGCRYGRLVLLTRSPDAKRTSWKCQCDCGAVVIKAQAELRRGDVRSCGCLLRDSTVRRNYVHGHSAKGQETAAYKKWKSMRRRVRYPVGAKNKCYVGVTIDPAWEDFSVFLCDMGPPPKGYSLDRIDNTKGYSKDNCRWVPLDEQARNTTRNVFYKGLPISEAARRAGLHPGVVFDRVNKLGWDLEKALSTPKRVQNIQKKEIT